MSHIFQHHTFTSKSPKQMNWKKKVSSFNITRRYTFSPPSQINSPQKFPAFPHGLSTHCVVSDGAGWDFQGSASLNLAPADKTPVLLNTPAQGNLLPFACAHRCSKLQLRQIILHSNDSSPRGHRSYVEHQDFALRQLRHLPLFLCPFCPDTQKPPEEKKVHL